MAPGFPPDRRGGIEQSTRALARGLVLAGLEVAVFAGTDDSQVEAWPRIERLDDNGHVVRVHRVHRSDLYYGHWQKRRSPEVGAWFERVLAEERPDVMHLHHWVRLSDDLVLRAAVAGVPAVVTLHDLWVSCPLFFRLRPGSLRPCDEPIGPEACVPCVATVGPPTPWVSEDEQAALISGMRKRVCWELSLARSVHALSNFQAELLTQTLRPDSEALTITVLAPAGAGHCPRLEPRAPPAPCEPLVIGAWGGLHPIKGIDLMVEAVRVLHQAGRRVELRVSGTCEDEDYERRLRELSEGLPVSFDGGFPEGALHEQPAGRAHLMLSTTRARETWGLVLDEAVALGLPMVLPRSGAFPEHLPEGCGALYYRSGDLTELVEVLERVIVDPDLLPRLRAELPDPEDVLPPVSAHVAALLPHYEKAVRLGAPSVEAPTDDGIVRDWTAFWDRNISDP